MPVFRPLIVAVALLAEPLLMIEEPLVAATPIALPQSWSRAVPVLLIVPKLSTPFPVPPR